MTSDLLIALICLGPARQILMKMSNHLLTEMDTNINAVYFANLGGYSVKFYAMKTIKHYFQCINFHLVPREILTTSSFYLSF